jgi:glycosyltransferase involved in cell wall biosynthesis
MYDIVFDFSSSPNGGALRRLEAYATFFKKSNLSTIFLIHKNASYILSKYSEINYECISKNSFQKFFGKNKYLNKYKSKTTWLFSYGIPIENPIGKHNWFHISNALPLANFKVNLQPKLRYRMMLLSMKIRSARHNCTMVSAESQFTLDLYRQIDPMARSVILKNSFPTYRDYMDNFLPLFPKLKKYCLTVGTATYKRIDLAHELYLNLKVKHNLEILVVIGDILSVSKIIQNDKTVFFFSHLSDIEYFNLLRNSDIYISTSEIENSSCAVLEALYYEKPCYLSDIPSHRELTLNSREVILAGRKYIYIPNDMPNINFKSWESTIESMLDIMKSIS